MLQKARRAIMGVFTSGRPMFVPSTHLDDSKKKSHAALVSVLMQKMEPLSPDDVTMVRVPIGYDETYLSTRMVDFDLRVAEKKRELFVPSERLHIVTITHRAIMDGKVFYQAVLRKGKRIIVSSSYCVPIEEEELGPFRPKRSRKT